MSAEQAAPWENAEPDGGQPTATPEEVADLLANIFARPWEDPSRIPMVAAEACKVLGELAVGGSREATQCLRRIWQAVDLGAPIDEPHWESF